MRRTIIEVAHHPTPPRSVVVAAAAASVVVAWRLLAPAVRTAEAALVHLVLAVGGVSSDRVADQLMVRRADGASFVASIGPWCSAFGPLLLFGALATVARGDGRLRRALVASAVVLVANVGRLVVVIGIGAHTDAATLERWHDGGGVAVAVVSTLGAAGWLVSRLWPMPSTTRGTGAPPLCLP